MEKQKQKARVIALPTDKPTGLFRIGPQWFNSIVMKARTDNEGYHLYFVTDEKPKEGDWFIQTYTMQLHQYKGWKEDGWDESMKKIVATTNPELWYKTYGRHSGFSGIGKIAPDFVEAFVKAEGKIEEVFLGYKLFSEDSGQGGYDYWGLDLNASGQVKVYPVNPKMYSKEELKRIAVEFAVDFAIEFALSGQRIHFDDWFAKKYPK